MASENDTTTASTSGPTMKAFRFHEAHSPLRLSDIPRPTPKPHEVLIQVKAAGLCHSDCIVMEDEDYGMLMQRPITLGHEVAGVIIEIGANVQGYNIGDQIASAQMSQPATIENWSNAIGLAYDGGYAEFAIVRATNITRIPERVTFAQAAVATDSGGRVRPKRVCPVNSCRRDRC